MAQTKQSVSHVYYEVGSELLAKPTALTQLIEGSDARATIVFCNSASDTDLVEVLLKKRGVAAQKLLGSISPDKAARVAEQLEKGEITTIVATDASAKNISIDSFDLLISYASPTDGDTYKNRFASEEPLKNLKTIATLVSPNDLANFEFVQQAVDGVILADKEKTVILGYLLANTLEVLPSLQSAQSRDEDHYDDDDTQPNFNGSGNDRHGGNRYGQGRGNDRRGGGNDRGPRNNNNNRGGRDNRNGRQPYADLNDDSESSLQAREAMARNKKRAFTPPLKEARIYIGQGAASGMNEAAIKKLVQEKASLAETDVRRVIVRKNYAFFDVLDAQAEDVIGKIDGASLMVKKATVISTQQRDNREDEGDVAPTLEEATSQASGAIAANGE